MPSRTPLFSRHQAGGVFTVIDVPKNPGSVWWVDSSNALASDAAGYGQNPDKPFATINYAVTQATADKNDVIYVMPGHTEAISGAAGIAVGVAGVQIVGLGSGAKRPTIDFAVGGTTAETLTITAANVLLKNLLFTISKNAVVSAIVISAADCTLEDCEIRDTGDTVEAAIGILTTAAADRLRLVRLLYNGRTGGSANTRMVDLVGADHAEITDCDFYGKSSVACINFTTTACTDVVIRGCTFYNSGTALTKDVIDTITGSTWTVDRCFDGVGGYKIAGGSGNALATDPSIAAVTDAIYGVNGIVTYLPGAVAGNAVSISEVLRWVQEGLRVGTGGTVPGANKNILDAIGFDGVAAIAASAGMLRTKEGEFFIVRKTFLSTAIVLLGADITGLVTTGAVGIEEITLETDAVGLATGTNVEIQTTDTFGVVKAGGIATVANLGASKTIDMTNSGTTNMIPFTMAVGTKLTINSTGMDCTGAGNLRVTVRCRRLADGANLLAA